MRLFLLLLLCLPIAATAQTNSGYLLTERNTRASAVSARFSNSANMATVSPEGKFTITVTSLPDTLHLSAPGMESYSLIITPEMMADPNFEVVLLDKRNATVDRADAPKAASYSVERESMKLSPASTDEVVVHGSRANPSPGAKKSKAEHKDPKREPVRKTTDTEVTTIADDADEPPPPPPASYMEESPVLMSASAPPASKPAGPSIVNGKTFVATVEDKPAAAVATPAARKMTAGEVNDLHRWGLWTDYTEAEFADVSKLMGFKPVRRYAVQVSNGASGPAMNETVQLFDANNPSTPIWTAITDNTGKAELWAEPLNLVPTTKSYLIALQGSSPKPAIAFESGINHLNTAKSCYTPKAVEIAFIVDATGSMSDEIDFLKLEMEEVVRTAFAELGENSSLRFASVFYRDNGDEYVTKRFDFNNQLLKVANFIKLQRSGGGGDIPEGVLEAMEQAIDSLAWSSDARSRILFLVSDAPPHQETMARVNQLTIKAAAKGVRIVPIGCSGTNKSNEYILRSMALATNGTYLAVTNHSGVGGSHEEPLTDEYRVELLNQAMRRVIAEYSFTYDCAQPDSTQYPTQLQKVNPNEVKATPNPTHGPINLTFTKGITDLFLCDLSGKILERIPVNTRDNSASFDLVQYPSGVYIIRYTNEEKKTGAVQVVVRH
jgi:von Willebrand factor type A domain/Secretion system C-terminal sorting domain